MADIAVGVQLSFFSMMQCINRDVAQRHIAARMRPCAADSQDGKPIISLEFVYFSRRVAGSNDKGSHK